MALLCGEKYSVTYYTYIIHCLTDARRYYVPAIGSAPVRERGCTCRVIDPANETLCARRFKEVGFQFSMSVEAKRLSNLGANSLHTRLQCLRLAMDPINFAQGFWPVRPFYKPLHLCIVIDLRNLIRCKCVRCKKRAVLLSGFSSLAT